MNTLSVVIITLNEEQKIARCLDSVAPIADEIIVVDSFSTDATEEICRRYDKLTFVKHAWEGYTAQKNFANSLATCDLIFSIDADEVLSPQLTDAIMNVKNKPLTDKAFSMNRLMNYCGQWIHHGGWYPDTKLRLFVNGKARWVGEKVHETLQLDDGIKVEHLDGDMLHYSFYSVEEHRRQIEKYATLSAEELASKGVKKSIFAAYSHAVWRFIRDYFFKAGFLDGKNGYIISKINTYGVLYKYKVLYKYNNSKEQ